MPELPGFWRICWKDTTAIWCPQSRVLTLRLSCSFRKWIAQKFFHFPMFSGEWAERVACLLQDGHHALADLARSRAQFWGKFCQFPLYLPIPPFSARGRRPMPHKFVALLSDGTAEIGKFLKFSPGGQHLDPKRVPGQLQILLNPFLAHSEHFSCHLPKWHCLVELQVFKPYNFCLNFVSELPLNRPVILNSPHSR